MIFASRGCLLSLMAAGGALAEADALVRLEGLLAHALEANERLAALVEQQRQEIAELREMLAVRDRELERVNAELAVLKRMLFGRSSERARRPPTAAVTAAATATLGVGRAAGRAGSGGRERGRVGGTTRTFRGWRWCGTFPAAGTAARSARRRSTGWGITSPRCWTGW